jgi:hypothetical protein
VEREIARGLAAARLDVYRVDAAAAGATVELVSLTDGTHVNVFAEGGFELLDIGDTLVARIVHNTSSRLPGDSAPDSTASTSGVGARASTSSRATVRRQHSSCSSSTPTTRPSRFLTVETCMA